LFRVKHFHPLVRIILPDSAQRARASKDAASSSSSRWQKLLQLLRSESQIRASQTSERKMKE